MTDKVIILRSTAEAILKLFDDDEMPDDVRADLSRLRAAKPAVSVKRLKFGEGPFGWLCVTPMAEYSIRKGVRKLKVRIVERQTETAFSEETFESARAACQAHYDEAILSALDAAPEPQGEVEPSDDVAEALASAAGKVASAWHESKPLTEDVMQALFNAFLNYRIEHRAHAPAKPPYADSSRELTDSEVAEVNDGACVMAERGFKVEETISLEPSDEEVERVAEALWERHCAPLPPSVPWREVEGIQPNTAKMLRADARAAIKAMGR